MTAVRGGSVGIVWCRWRPERRWVRRRAANGVGSVVLVDNVGGWIARVPFSDPATRRAEPAVGVAGGDGDRAAAGDAGAGCDGRPGVQGTAQCVAALLVGPSDTTARDGNHDPGVQKTVQDGRGEHWVAEAFSPPGDAGVGGDDRRGLQVAPRDHFGQRSVGVGVGMGSGVGEFVDDQQAGRRRTACRWPTGPPERPCGIVRRARRRW